MLPQLSRLTKIVVIGILLIVVIPISYLKFGQIGLEATSISYSALLTLGLIYLYYEQQEVLKSQQKPLIDLDEISIVSDFGDVQVTMSNFGGGAATSLSLVIELYDQNGNGPLDVASGELKRIQSGDKMESLTQSSSIRPSEVGIKFETQSEYSLPSGGDERDRQTAFGRIIYEHLEEHEVIFGRIIIEYESVFQESEYHPNVSIKLTEHKGSIANSSTNHLPWENGSFAR